MRRILTSMCATFAVLFAVPACAQDETAPAAAETQDVYAFIGVTVVPMDSERHIVDQTVIVRDDHIAEIGPAEDVAVPEGAVRIVGEGRYLMPGLAEMHAHVPPDPDATQWTEDVLFLYAANGITFARGMLGAPHHLALRERLADGEIVGPRLYTSGPSLNDNSVATPEDGARMVREQHAAGYDFLKIHPGLDRARYDAIVAAANTHGISFAGHVPADVGIEHVLEAGQVTIDHLDGYMALLMSDGSAATDPGFFGLNQAGAADFGLIAAAAERTRAAGVWNVPTDSLIRHIMMPSPTTDELMARPEMRYVPAAMRAAWRQARTQAHADPSYETAPIERYLEARALLILALNEVGAGLLLGSDAPQWFNVPGFALHRELSYLVDSGLSPYEALATGTRNVAAFLDSDDFGTVVIGNRADLVLLDGDPLADIGNAGRIAGVMSNGRWLSSADIDAGLAAIAVRYAE